ncbi:Spy/CpxP family protein refolding chaperone [Paraburkholderia sp.]|uniref:Spy/CpxP family protein refolding chaperone n=1 Tax=Paraburkholderia sp. TaxID=1926495 RepID=UPI003D6E5EAA
MKNLACSVLTPAMIALALTTTPVWAQTPASSAAPASAAAANARAQKHEDHVEQRIITLRSKLKITDQQTQQWDAFAQTMRDNARDTDQAFRDRAQKLATMNADDAMKSYLALAQLQAENMQKLSTAFSALYGALSDDQKKTADVLFRNAESHAHGKQHMTPRERKPAAAGAASAPVPASS